MRKLNQTFGNVAYGAFSDSNNYATETNNFGETAFGILNKSTIDPDNFTSRDVVKSSKATLFSIGNGTEEERKNVIEIKGNGDVYINGVAGYTGTDTDQAGNIAEEFQGVHDSIDELDRRADETDVEIGEINQHLDNVDSTLDSIHIQKGDDSDLVYTLIVDGEERGTINIPKDQFLEDVSYDPDTKELVFIFVTSDENNKEVRINIENLVDVYSAGNGLSLADGLFAIKLDPSTESYITVGADGLKVSGLDAKFDTLTLKDTELDGRILTAETDIDALLSDLSALKGDGEGSIGNLILTAVDALKGGVSESYDTLKKIEDSIVSTNNSYLKWENPTTGPHYIDTTEDGLYFGMGSEYVTMFIKEDNRSIIIDTTGVNIYNRDRRNVIDKYVSVDCKSEPLIDLLDMTEDTHLQIACSNITFSTERHIGTPLCILDKTGITLADKTTSDLLHAAGGTTTLKTINNNSLLGSGNIEVPTTESIQDITGSNTYTGANYISKETNLTDAVMQLDEEVKAVNDNVELEHANAEATYVKKAGDTMTGDLTVPNVVVTSNGAIDGRKLRIHNAGIEVIAPNTGTAYNDSFLRIKDPTGENTIFNAFCVFSDSGVAGEGTQMAYIGGYYDTPTLSVFDTGLVGIGRSPTNPPTEKLDVNGNVKATKFIGPLQGNADTATKATQDANGLNIASTYSKLDTTPFAGTGLYDAERPTLTDWLSAHRSYIGTWKGDGTNDWTNVISSRHRNGDDDGNEYGMYIANKLIGDGVGTLRWDQLVNGVWQGEKVILDSSNYTDYVPTLEEITTQVTAKLVDGAPETLDTLNELAAALGDDPNFATTITNQIAQKADLSILPDYIVTSLRDTVDYTENDMSLWHSFVSKGNNYSTRSSSVITFDPATSTTAGVMSAADKAKLDSIETSDFATKAELDDYLPLTGGTITGIINALGTDSSVSIGEYYTGFSGEGFYITQDSNKGTRVLSISRMPKGEGTLADGSAQIAFSDNHSNITLSITRQRIWLKEPKANAKYLEVNSKGIVIEDKTSSDLLHAAGGTTTLKTINGESLLGSGDITTPTPTVNAASGTKTIWTGTQSEYEAVTSKDANTLYFITEG